ncbi:Uncharacterised protein [uncultured archaeon]|nr:Uncharacterised protein [uncultured archaeon]
MVTDKTEMEQRLAELTDELAKETDAKRRAQLMLERSLFANMFMNKKN